MFQVRKVTTEGDYQAALHVRRIVFVEEQGVPASAEVDEYEASANHFVALDSDGAPCGAARWRRTENGAKLERFAVLQAVRRHSVGRQLLESVLADVAQSAPELRRYLHAQIDVVGFYEKFGFEPYGDEFVECDIVHQAMQLPLDRRTA